MLFVMTGEAGPGDAAGSLAACDYDSMASKSNPCMDGALVLTFPTLETLAGQALAVVVVLGSYALAQKPGSLRQP